MQARELAPARFAEWLQRIATLVGLAKSREHELLELARREICLRVLLSDPLDRLRRRGYDGRGRAELDSVLERVDLEDLFRVVQRMIERVDRQLRAFADEFGVELLTLSSSASINWRRASARWLIQLVATLAERPTSDPTSALTALSVGVSIFTALRVSPECPSSSPLQVDCGAGG